MRKTGFIVTLTLLVASGVASSGQSPVNDHFTNRVELVGSSVTFTGLTTGATLETGEDALNSPCYMSGGSIWWTWTAPANCQAVIELPPIGFVGDYYGIEILTGTNWPALTNLTCSLIDGIPYHSVAFAATAGETYQIRLVGAFTFPVVMRLMATNGPVFLSAPRTRTVSSN